MKKRDRAILSDLERFRCLTRADITELHFAGLSKGVEQTNEVLKRLRRDGLIECSTSRRMFTYFPHPSPIKKDGAKVSHYLAIADFFKQLRRIEEPREFIPEPKYGKGNPEPDAFVVWQRTPFYIEIQRSVYSEKVMNEKMKRYERYWKNEEWHEGAWQPAVGKKLFPIVWIVGEKTYDIETKFKVIQSRNASEMLSIRRSPPN